MDNPVLPSTKYQLTEKVLTRVFRKLKGIDLLPASYAYTKWNDVMCDQKLWLEVYENEIIPASWVNECLVKELQELVLLDCDRKKAMKTVFEDVNYVQLVAGIKTFILHMDRATEARDKKSEGLERSIFVGPGVDAPGVCRRFCEQLLKTSKIHDSSNVYDRFFIELELVEQKSGKQSIASLFHARLPSRVGDAFGGGDRVEGNPLVQMDEDNPLQVTPQLRACMMKAKTVVYTIDATTAQLRTDQITPHLVNRFWSSVREELTAVIRGKPERTRLLILAICDDVTSKDEPLLMKVIKLLGGTDATASSEECPLSIAGLEYNICCVYTDGADFRNLADVLEWVAN